MPGDWIPLDALPAFPGGHCACCMAPTDRELSVPSRFRAADSLLGPTDKPWRVPYCEPCLAHVREAWARVGSFKKRWARTAAFALVPGLVFHALLVPLITLFLLGSVAVLALARARERTVGIGSACACPGPAVLRRGPSGSRYWVRFRNRDYAERFAAASGPQRDT
ncbi:MAG: hypothetical protein FJZ01_24230 [Candidatus Sericytochromatia bacterium]|nr:hypothetical protein [Candidatus Tanganyikabacteria bacterium]